MELLSNKSNTWRHIAAVCLQVFCFIIVPIIIIASIPRPHDDNTTNQVPSTYPDLITILPKNWTVTGVRQDINGNIAITGTESTNPVGDISAAFLYYGPLTAIPNTKSSPSLHYFLPQFPGETTTFAALYGPNTYLYDSKLGENNILAVGGYNYKESPYQAGFMYQGPLDGSGVYTKLHIPPRPINVTLANGTTIHTLDYPARVVAHSVMGDLIVGNCYFQSSQTRSSGFIYSLTTGFIRTIDVDVFSTSTYGIWQNGGENSVHYTLVGGLSYIDTNLSLAYIMNYDATNNRFSEYSTYTYQGQPQAGTHFEGISKVNGGYTMASIELTASRYQSAALCFIPSNPDGSFGAATWVELKGPAGSFISANTVLNNFIFGIYSTEQPSSAGEFFQETSFYTNCTTFLSLPA